MRSIPERNMVRRRMAPTRKVRTPAAAPKEECSVSTVVRLLVFATVTVAIVMATVRIINQDWTGGKQATVQDCVEMKEIDQACKNLGLDGLPGYRETCFSLGERLPEAAEPFTGPVADGLQDLYGRVCRSLHLSLQLP